MLADSIADHPDISGLTGTPKEENEGEFLENVTPHHNEHGGPGLFALDERMEWTEEHVREGMRTRMLEAFKPYWDISRPILLEKSIGTICRLRFMQALFPDALFVTMIRHPVVTTAATLKWAGLKSWSILRNWIAAHRIVEQHAPRLDRLICIPYQEFVRSPDRHLGRVYEHLNLPLQPCEREIQTGLNARYFRKWWRGLGGRREIPIRILACAAHEATIRSFGYSCFDVDRFDPAWMWSLETGPGSTRA